MNNIRQIRSFIYTQDYDKALTLLLDIIEKQNKEVQELKDKVITKK